jgi:hypothetical protein
MRQKLNYFNIVSLAFLAIVIFLLILSVLDGGGIFFDGENLPERIARSDLEKRKGMKDTLPEPSPSDSTMKFVWRWKSAVSERHYVMEFSLSKEGIRAARQNRAEEDVTSIEDMYRRLFAKDAPILQPMISSYMQLAKSNGLNYMEAMEMVVSSIQSIDYTWVLDRNPSCGESIPTTDGGSVKIPRGNCAVLSAGRGCCDGINWGVFSPVEFVVGRKGDCDTRSVLAFTLLRRMGYDVAVMLRPTHSVLGVNVPNVPGDGKKGNVGDAKNYYLWELTAFGQSLGEFIYGDDWYIGIK